MVFTGESGLGGSMLMDFEWFLSRCDFVRKLGETQRIQRMLNVFFGVVFGR